MVIEPIITEKYIILYIFINVSILNSIDKFKYYQLYYRMKNNLYT